MFPAESRMEYPCPDQDIYDLDSQSLQNQHFAIIHTYSSQKKTQPTRSKLTNQEMQHQWDLCDDSLVH